MSQNLNDTPSLVKTIDLPIKYLVNYLQKCLNEHLNDNTKFVADLDTLLKELKINSSIKLSENFWDPKAIIGTNPNLSYRSATLIIIFLFLSGILDNQNRDKDGRIHSWKSIYYSALKNQPFICDDLLNGLGLSLKNRSAKINLTCDIDWPFFYSNDFRGWLRKCFHILTGKYIGDRFDNFTDMVKLGNKYKLSWLFFLLPEGKDYRDPNKFEFYRLRKRIIQLRRLNTKTKIGYHIPISIVTGRLSEYPRLEELREFFSIESVRSHYLTWSTNMDSISCQQKFTIDYSSGYTDIFSSVNGFSREIYSWEGFINNNLLKKIQTNFMDIHLEKNESDSIENLTRLIKDFKKYGADFTIIWHNDKFKMKQLREDTLDLEEIINLWQKI